MSQNHCIYQRISPDGKSYTETLKAMLAGIAKAKA
jgi:hypothetical protein